MAYSERVTAAVELARRVHDADLRKGSSIPYLSHLFAVAALVMEYGGDEDQVIAALLHDTVEDHPDAIGLESVDAHFGARVAALVAACSDTLESPKPPWRARKERFVTATRNAHPEVKLIIAADKLHNARSVARDLRSHGVEVWSRFRGEQSGSLWYYAEMVAALADGWPHPIVAELRDTVGILHALSQPQD